MALANVFNAKVVNNEREGDRMPCVAPETWDSFGLVVTLGVESLGWKVIGKHTSLGEAILRNLF